MHATILLDELDSRTFDHRATPREAVALPILIVVDGTRQKALIRKLSRLSDDRGSGALHVRMKSISV